MTSLTNVHDDEPALLETGEEAPLLAPAQESRILFPQNSGGDRAMSPSPFKLTSTTMFCMILLFLIEMYDFITSAPFVALFERSICRIYYKLHGS